ncbi:MAG TPA: hypothetical protein VMU41_09650 [Candidatus Binataceae bacterium]|nr:hypothetical protein [Candidatus Binataceae bacterium]
MLAASHRHGFASEAYWGRAVIMQDQRGGWTVPIVRLYIAVSDMRPGQRIRNQGMRAMLK